MKTLYVLALAAILTACGGSSTQPPVDNTQAIKDAVTNIGNNTPPPKVYEGSFAGIENMPIGWVPGKSFVEAVKAAVAPILAEPSKYSESYKLLLSDRGLKVALFGEIVGGSLEGLVQHKPDTNFVVTLRPDGLHVVQTN